ncbi:MAG TPA: dimethylsulfonioproprionate lyase family protein [Methylomirabilota bacterium]|nr:dimethylsulfonioproprionate lyase family protein [Methylomirabilota bacterium]
MTGSISHPDPATRRAALGRFLGALNGELRAAAAARAEGDVAESLRDFTRLLGAIDADRAAREPAGPPERLGVCRFWEASLRAADGIPPALVAALETLGPCLSWAQNPNYRRRPPDPTFLDHYGYAVVAGPADGPPALAVDSRLAVGVLLLGPGAHYPLHAHPAIEVYYTLTAGAAWWRADGPWRCEPAGAFIHHEPGVRHATRAGASPLLAVYLWRGDLATHARLTPSASNRTSRV